MADQAYLDSLVLEVITNDPSGVVATLDSFGIEVVYESEIQARLDGFRVSIVWAEATGPAFTEHYTAVDAVSDVEGGGSGWRRWD